MSEQKRVALTPVITSMPAPSGTVGTSVVTAAPTNPAASRFGADFFSDQDKANNGGGEATSNGRRNEKTIRLQLELFPTDSSTYPEFNYAKLMRLEKKKLKKLKQKSNGCSDPFAENDDDVARIAQELEKKYGSSYGSGRGRSKKDDHCDIGLGYDESDSFIDNTEAYDEVIPEEVETIEGGFYINCGALEFKKLHTESLTTKTDEIIKMPNRPKKRLLSTSSEDSSSSEGGDDEQDEDENDTGVESTVENSKDKNGKGAEKRQRPSNASATAVKKAQENNAKKEKTITISVSSSNSPKTTIEEVGSDSDKERMRQKSVKTTTVKDMLKAKRDSFLKLQVGSEAKTLNGDIKQAGSAASAKTSSDETSSEDSDDSSDTSDVNQEVPQETKTKKAEENSEKLRTGDIKLPELDSEVMAGVQSFKELVKSRNMAGKKFIFDDKLAEVFLKIDDTLLCTEKTHRNMVFAHLESHLLMPKYFLLRKAKQLRIKEEKQKSKRSLSKLRKAVIEAMPNAIGNYEVELRKYADLQADNLNSDQPPKMPKKKFPWTSIMRNLLYDVYQVRWTSYPVLATRKETLEDFITVYMKDKVVDLWPVGWMRYEELQKEIEKSKAATKRAKDKKKNTASNPTTANTASSNLPDTLLATATLPASSAFSKQFEEFTSSRSCANSDTDSVASSVASSGLKRKNADAIKQTKSKALKTNGEQTKVSETIKMQQQPQKSPPTTSPTLVDLLSPSKRTDHSIYSIISSTSPPPASSSGQKPQLPQKKHSKLSERTSAHIIDLDNYTSTSDILQTSKQILNAAAAAAAGSAPSATTTTTTSQCKTERSASQPYIGNTLHTLRRESGSESDGVEITGVFPAKPVAPVRQKAKKSGGPYQNSRLHVDFSASLAATTKNAATINNNNNNKKGSPQWVGNANAKNASDRSSAAANSQEFDVTKVAKVLKDLEDLHNMQQKGATPSQPLQNASTKDHCQ